ncbi:hypothetical protein GL325_04040 [Aeromicrobium sp. 636]|uniref:Uncharacterized protein n=1 Tax=Aeromicrobium senzhongii TaxID=2663859 RepID=A0A8I0K079_9ACTN|nr:MULTISPECIES: hypothetical protein [Aeromicrobium]MBC9225488.1 hypothetical protein [Aeromicrobium senzhongii]MCQ3997598.1 hypothetical protein [Aeromicrobium sp. 636]
MTDTVEHRRTWWQRNRIGLLALPLALALALAAGSSRLHDYWWTHGFHDPVPVSGGAASLVDQYDDGHLRYPIEAEYSVASFVPAEDLRLLGGDPLPDGVRAWRLSLAVEADPDTVLTGCTVAIVDTAGSLHRESDAGMTLDGSRFSTCVPADTPGPQPEFGSAAAPRLLEEDDVRPPTFTTDTVFLLPQEAVPAAVRLWYSLPRHVELPLEPSGV